MNSITAEIHGNLFKGKSYRRTDFHGTKREPIQQRECPALIYYGSKVSELKFHVYLGPDDVSIKLISF